MNIVKITASGKVGCGKSAVLGEIEIALRAIGLKVEWAEGSAEKGLTHADWITELEMYQPTVVLSEKIEPAAPAVQGDAKDEVYEFAAKVIELFDDATMRAGHMLDAGECATVIRALKSTEIASIAAKAAS